MYNIRNVQQWSPIDFFIFGYSRFFFIIILITSLDVWVRLPRV
jgi:hypothetical protein